MKKIVAIITFLATLTFIVPGCSGKKKVENAQATTTKAQTTAEISESVTETSFTVFVTEIPENAYIVKDVIEITSLEWEIIKTAFSEKFPFKGYVDLSPAQRSQLVAVAQTMGYEDVVIRSGRMYFDGIVASEYVKHHQASDKKATTSGQKNTAADVTEKN